MFLIEVAGQMVRGMSASVRTALKPGYIVLKPPGAESPALGSLISALLFSDGRGGDAAFIAAGQKSGRAGVTVLGNDQVTYRLVRELGGAGALHKLDKATGKFAVITEDPAEMGQLLRASVGVPVKSAFEQIFCLNAAQLPSKRSGAKARPSGSGTASSGPKPRLASAQTVEAAGDVGAAQARIKALEKELVMSKEIDQLQFKLDGVASQLFELETKLKGGEGARSALAEAEKALAHSPSPESLGLPKDILSRCERYPELVQKRDEALAKLGVEGGPGVEAPLEEDTGPRFVAPLRQDPRFIGGLIGGVAFLGLGLFMSGPARYVTLLDIPAFGAAALFALKHIEELQDAQRTTRKGGMRETREKKIRATFEAEAQAVREAMKALGVETPQEAIEQLSRKPLLAEKVNELRGQLRQLQTDPVFAQASARQATLLKEQEALNQKLLERGGYIRPVTEVEGEIGRVKESIRLAQSGAAPASAEPTFAAVTAGTGESLVDPVPGLLAVAADLYHQDLPTVAGVIKDRCAQYLTALSDRRYHGIEVDREGKGTALAPGRKVLASQLPPKDLDLLYLALRLTLLEKAGAVAKVPFVVDDVFAQLDEAKVPLFARMLKHLGTTTQVIHVAAHAGFDPMADLVGKL